MHYASLALGTWKRVSPKRWQVKFYYSLNSDALRRNFDLFLYTSSAPPPTSPIINSEALLYINKVTVNVWMYYYWFM